MHQKITKAIIPVAGLGTRFLPATKAMPKEMMPVVNKPVVQYVVEEAVASGVTDIVFVTGRGKTAIEDHFDTSYELEDTLVEKNKKDLLREVRKISSLAKFSYVRQPMPLGDGNAIVQAAHLVGNEPVLVMFADCIYDSAKPAAQQLIETFYNYGHSIVGLTRVPKKEVNKFGVYAGPRIGKNVTRIERVAEKPTPAKAPSNLVTPGRYIITPEVLKILGTMTRGKSGEIRLIDAFDIMLSRKKPLFGRILDGLWLDTGDKLNFIKATIHFGLQHAEIKNKLRAYLRTAVQS